MSSVSIAIRGIWAKLVLNCEQVIYMLYTKIYQIFCRKMIFMLTELKESCVNVRFTGKKIMQIGHPVDGNCKGFEIKKLKKTSSKQYMTKMRSCIYLSCLLPEFWSLKRQKYYGLSGSKLLLSRFQTLKMQD